MVKDASNLASFYGSHIFSSVSGLEQKMTSKVEIFFVKQLDFYLKRSDVSVSCYVVKGGDKHLFSKGVEFVDPTDCGK